MTLKVNNKIPRIAKRFEDAFKAAGLDFHKTRPMRLLLTKMGTSPDEIMLNGVAKRFETLCRVVNERLPGGNGKSSTATKENRNSKVVR